MDGCWTWYNRPHCVYDAARGRLYFGAIRSDGWVRVASWDFAARSLRLGSPRAAAIQVDDHNDPSLCLLDDGSLLAAYSQHITGGGLTSWCNRTGTDGDVRSWGSEVPIDTSPASPGYAQLWQAGDAAGTVYWYWRRGAGRREFRTSADRGSSWTERGGFVELSGQRPYVVMAPNGPLRLDFLVSTGNATEVTCSLYHFYMLVDESTGARTYHKSDGTLVGTDSALPLTPGTAHMTLVWDGATRNSWNWDIAIIGGVPVVAFSTFTTASTTDDTHHYHQARWSGSAWVQEEICEGGVAATTPHWLYAAQPNYSGGIGLDPNDADAVYVSRKHGAGDWRLERWEHSGTFGSGGWSKAADVSGNTGTVNARPWCVRGLSPTTVGWWEGAYTAYTNYRTRVRFDPPFDWRGEKPASPAWTPADAPAGAKAYYLLGEGSGAPQDLSGNGYHGTLVGSPTWDAGDAGDHGPFLRGFGTSNYVQINALAAAYSGAGFADDYPAWVAVLYKTTSSAIGWQAALGRSASNNPVFGVRNREGFWRDDANTGGLILDDYALATNYNDGEYHVAQVVKRSSSLLLLHHDGRPIRQSTTSTGALTLDRGAIGALVRGSAAEAFAGEVHAVIFGAGAEPDPEWLALDLLHGQFSGTFDAGGGGGFNAAWARNSNVVIAGVLR